MLGLGIFGYILYGVSAVIAGTAKIVEREKYNKAIRDSGYNIIDKKQVNKYCPGSYQDRTLEIQLLLSLMPYINIGSAIVAILINIQKIDPYKKEKFIKDMLLVHNIEKSEELLLLEESNILKQERMTKAREAFCSGKVSNFDNLSKNDQIKLIAKEREKIEDNFVFEENNDYDKLSREEKIELLNNMRREILGEYNDFVVTNNIKKIKRKNKK